MESYQPSETASYVYANKRIPSILPDLMKKWFHKIAKFGQRDGVSVIRYTGTTKLKKVYLIIMTAS